MKNRKFMKSLFATLLCVATVAVGLPITAKAEEVTTDKPWVDWHITNTKELHLTNEDAQTIKSEYFNCEVWDDVVYVCNDDTTMSINIDNSLGEFKCHGTDAYGKYMYANIYYYSISRDDNGRIVLTCNYWNDGGSMGIDGNHNTYDGRNIKKSISRERYTGILYVKEVMYYDNEGNEKNSLLFFIADEDVDLLNYKDTAELEDDYADYTVANGDINTLVSREYYVEDGEDYSNKNKKVSIEVKNDISRKYIDSNDLTVLDTGWDWDSRNLSERVYMGKIGEANNNQAVLFDDNTEISIDWDNTTVSKDDISDILIYGCKLSRDEQGKLIVRGEDSYSTEKRLAVVYSNYVDGWSLYSPSDNLSAFDNYKLSNIANSDYDFYYVQIWVDYGTHYLRHTDGYCIDYYFVPSDNDGVLNYAYLVNLTDSDTSISLGDLKSVIEENDTKEVFIKTDNGVEITFDKGTMSAVDGIDNYDFGTTIITDYDLAEESASYVKNSDFVAQVNFNYSGKLPATATIKIPVGKEYAGQTLNYSQLQDSGIELVQSVRADEAGYITIKQEHCSNYVITKSASYTITKSSIKDGDSNNETKTDDDNKTTDDNNTSDDSNSTTDDSNSTTGDNTTDDSNATDDNSSNTDSNSETPSVTPNDTTLKNSETPDNNTNNTTTRQSTAPKTGDNTDTYVWLMMIAVSVSAVAVVVSKKMKNA